MKKSKKEKIKVKKLIRLLNNSSCYNCQFGEKYDEKRVNCKERFQEKTFSNYWSMSSKPKKVSKKYNSLMLKEYDDYCPKFKSLLEKEHI